MGTAKASRAAQAAGSSHHRYSAASSSVALSAAGTFLYWLSLLSIMRLPTASADCWLIEGEKGFVWLAICSMNQPPYEAIPPHINR